jgi:hypothetical protein
MTQISTPRSIWQGGGAATKKTARGRANPMRTPALMVFFGYEVILLTVMQKFAFPIGFGNLGGSIEAALPLTYPAMFALMFFAQFKVDRVRVALLTIALIFAFLTLSMVSGTYSIHSVMLMLLIYLPYVLYIEVSEATYHKLINIFLNAMFVFGVIAIVQQLAQFVWSWHVWPNLDQIIPANYQFQGFIYIQPFNYGSPYMKPNSIFFLEVSYLSQWTAIALALELVYFRRLWRMCFYAAILLGSFAGTGLLLLLISGPVLLSRVSRRSLIGVGIVLIVCGVTAFSINWLQQVEHRFTEVQYYGSSAYHRFVIPFQVLADFVSHPMSFLVGEGPGNGAKQTGDMWWAFTKIAYEYGVLAGIFFEIFVGYVLFKKAASQRIAFMLIIFFNFMGGFIIPVYPLLIWLIGGLFRIRGSKSEAGGAEKGGSAEDGGDSGSQGGRRSDSGMRGWTQSDQLRPRRSRA